MNGSKYHFVPGKTSDGGENMGPQNVASTSAAGGVLLPQLNNYLFSLAGPDRGSESISSSDMVSACWGNLWT